MEPVCTGGLAQRRAVTWKLFTSNAIIGGSVICPGVQIIAPAEFIQFNIRNAVEKSAAMLRKSRKPGAAKIWKL
jgi:hypothetical protein